jgi:hypothetical protein
VEPPLPQSLSRRALSSLPRSDRFRDFFLNGLSEHGGLDDVDESFPKRRPLQLLYRAGELCDQPIRIRQPRGKLLTGRAASFSADGRPGSSGTARRHAVTAASQPPEQRTATTPEPAITC